MAAKPKKGQVVEVLWKDAAELESSVSWFTESVLKYAIKQQDSSVHTVGYYWGTQDMWTILYSSYGPPQDEFARETFSGISLIPTNLIFSMKVINNGKKRNLRK